MCCLVMKISYALSMPKPPPMPPDVAKAMAHLDAVSAAWPLEDKSAWILYRGFTRQYRPPSQTQLSSVATVAQEVVQIRDHAHAALAAMEGVFGQQSGDEPDTSKQKKVLDDGT